MVASRIGMCLLLFHLLENLLWVFGLCLLFHMVATFVAHLLSYHKHYDSFYGLGKLKSFPIVSFIRNKDFNRELRNCISTIAKRVFLVFSLSWSEFLIVLLRHPIEFLQSNPDIHHLRSTRCFALTMLFHFLEVVAVGLSCIATHTHYAGRLHRANIKSFHVSYVSITLYVVSGVFFLLYYTLCNPDREGSYSSLRLAIRFN